jgi:hypothetical protein
MATLRERIDAEWENIDKVIHSLPEVRRLNSLSPLELAGVGSLIHGFYNGIENILKQCVVAADFNLPDGPSWHQDLLKLATSQHVISESVSEKLRLYLAFRHFFSHGYSFEVEAGRIQPLIEDLPFIVSEFQKEVKMFIRTI